MQKSILQSERNDCIYFRVNICTFRRKRTPGVLVHLNAQCKVFNENTNESKYKGEVTNLFATANGPDKKFCSFYYGGC